MDVLFMNFDLFLLILVIKLLAVLHLKFIHLPSEIPLKDNFTQMNEYMIVIFWLSRSLKPIFENALQILVELPFLVRNAFVENRNGATIWIVTCLFISSQNLFNREDFCFLLFHNFRFEVW